MAPSLARLSGSGDSGTPAGDRKASEVLGGAPSPDAVRAIEVTRLKALLAQLRTGLDRSSGSVTQFRRTARKRLPLEDRSRFDAAFAQVRACEVALRTSILAASQADSAHAKAAQSRVADAYEAYARAVMVAQATAKSSRAAALATNIPE